MRSTSIEAYKQVRESGLVGERQQQVYDVLYQHGPLTTNEIFSRLYGTTSINQPNVHARLAELRAMGVVSEVDTVTCSITNRRVIQWDVTAKLPIKPARRQTSKQIIADLQRQLAELRGEKYELN